MEYSEEIIRLESEISQLESELQKKKIELASMQNINKDTNKATVSINSHSDEKIKLFRSLFHGREDVFTLRFESKKKLVNQDISLHAGMNGYREFAENLK